MDRKLIQKSVEGLIAKAEDGFDLAKSQRASADKLQESVDQQHKSAHKLEELSKALRDDASEIKDEMAIEQAGTGAAATPRT